jgi:hypothetical protein
MISNEIAQHDRMDVFVLVGYWLHQSCFERFEWHFAQLTLSDTVD